MSRKEKSKKRTLRVDVIPKPKFDSDLENRLDEELKTTYSFKILMKIREDLIKDASILFGGSTDATLMCRKIDEIFNKYV